MSEDTLFVTAGPAAGTEIEVEDELLIGRRTSGQGRLGGDTELSRRHALLRRSGTELTIVDLGSTNGTRVNGRLVSAPTELQSGDRIELGSSAISVGSIPPAVSAGPGGDQGGAALPPFSVPAVARDDRAARRRGYEIGLALLAALAVAAAVVLLITRGSGSSTGVDRPFDGTVYIESNIAKPDANSVLALRYRAGSFRPLQVTEYPTGGSGSHDLKDSGVLDADQQIIVNDDRTLLFAINQGSDSIAVFHVEDDGSLRPVRGSPFPSGGTAPGSLGISGDILVVANKAHDGVRDLTSFQANYTTFRVSGEGTLHPTGSSFLLPPRSSPTQVYVAPGGRLVFASEETGLMRAFQLTSDGRLIQAPDSPQALPDTLFVKGERPHPVWPAGLSADGDQRVLYTGIPNYGSIVAYDYDISGRLRLDGEEADPDAFLPCWSVVSRDGRRLYFANAGTDNISVWDIATDPRHPRLLQDVQLPGGGNPWNLHLDPTGKFLYIITPRQVRQIPRGDGQLLHSLAVGADGKLKELSSSPVPLPVALNTNPLGLAVVPRR